jgi:hypothetical protein
MHLGPRVNTGLQRLARGSELAPVLESMAHPAFADFAQDLIVTYLTGKLAQPLCLAPRLTEIGDSHQFSTGQSEFHSGPHRSAFNEW